MSKKESNLNLPKQLKFTQVGRTVVVIEGKTKYTLTFPTGAKEDITKFKKSLESYNKLPTEHKLKLIMYKLTHKKAKEEAQKKSELKKVKHELKEAEHAVKGKRREVKQLKASMGADGDQFEVRDGEMYLKPYFEVPIPSTLVQEIKKFIELKISLEPLINFWLLALLNPNPVARTKMFDYLTRQRLILTPHGYFVTYRMVKKTDDSNVYTHAHHSTKRLYYSPGTVCRIPRSECDEDGSKDCSRGLHTGTPAFIGLDGLEPLGEGYVEKKMEYRQKVDTYGTGYGPAEEIAHFSESYGNQAIICLINPAHVVSVPDSDTRKMRSCEFFFWKTTTVEEVTHMQFSDYLVAAHEYHEFERKELETMLKATKIKAFVDKNTDAKDSKALKKKVEELRAKLVIGQDPINTSLSIEDINKIIQSRVKPIKK